MTHPHNDPGLQSRLAWIQNRYPLVWQELTFFSADLSPRDRQDLEILYAGLDCHDLPCVTAEQMFSYVRASQQAQQAIGYTAAVPSDLFYSYVLPPRVNNEWLDSSREWLLAQLLPRIQDKDLLSAALEVNYWCAEQAAYLPTDDRTISPLGMCRRAQGRCGEESTLLVSALRAVGIPARQCYAPFWAHCDDNHAWVEFWADDGWHYMGACEPEWMPDVGWFQAAASKAPLIRSRVPDFSAPEGYRTVNTTSHYGNTVRLSVLVTDKEKPVPDAEVRFQLINYSRIQTLHTSITDDRGEAFLDAGVGSLIVSVSLDGTLVEHLVDLRREQTVILRREDGFCPETAESFHRWQLTPPRETIPAPLPKNEAHPKKLARCEALHASTLAHFRAKTDPWIRKACGNREEIRQFLMLPHYLREDKELLLETLTEKDFCDCTCRTLESFLASALPYKGDHPRARWQWEILAPRVEWEPLLPIRPEICRLLADTNLTTAEQVLQWMDRNLHREPEFGLTDRRGNAAGYLRHGRCPESEWDITAVQICRALGIPATLSGQTGRILTSENTFGVMLTLRTEEAAMKEEEHFSLSRWDGKTYVPVHLQADTIREETVISLDPGAYSLITCRRQIDGSVSVQIRRFLLSGDRHMTLSLEQDETARHLISADLPAFFTKPLTANAQSVSQLAEWSPSLLIFLQPGKEPTEHLLQELIGDAAAFLGVPIRFLVGFSQAMDNETLRHALGVLDTASVSLFREEDRFELQAAAGIGDARLPLALALDCRQKIVYGCANYNINTASTMHRILSLSSVRE